MLLSGGKRGMVMVICFDIGGSRIKVAAATGGLPAVTGDAPTPPEFTGFAAVPAGFLRGLWQGLDVLAAVFADAAGRIIIMPGVGIGPGNIGQMMAWLPLREVYAPCNVAGPAQGQPVEMGFGVPTARATDAGRVRAMKAALGG